MSTDQKQFLKKSAVKAIIIVSALASGAFSQVVDTAKVPVIVNVDATVSMSPTNPSPPINISPTPIYIGVNKTVKAGKADTLIIGILRPTSVSHRPQGQTGGVPALIKSSAGKASLSLPAASYKNAEVSLYTVNGKRVMSEKVTASSAVNNISRPNIAAGAYVLSVKGIDGGSFTARHTHDGGDLNIAVAFGHESAASADQLRKEANGLAAASWTIKAEATGYDAVSYEFTPVKGMNPLQNITLKPQSVASGGINCKRAGLTAAVDAYLKAMEAGDHALMPLAANAKYYENDNSAKQNYSTGKYDKEVKFGEGLWKTKIKPDFHRNLIDETECAAFSEIIVANTSPQYVLGARLRVTGDKISEVALVVTKDGDWGFNAKSYLNASSSKREDTVWAKPGRIDREDLRAGAYAYFAYFGDKTVEVPWGIPCTRVEGGMSTGDSPTATCNVGVPDVKVDPKGITYLADEEYGMVVLFLYFGGADSHMFKMLPSPTRYRYIHTLTAMKQSDFKP
jgi:hypothetical protein